MRTEKEIREFLKDCQQELEKDTQNQTKMFGTCFMVSTLEWVLGTPEPLSAEAEEALLKENLEIEWQQFGAA
jgi:hypothetical protein